MYKSIVWPVQPGREKGEGMMKINGVNVIFAANNADIWTENYSGGGV